MKHLFLLILIVPCLLFGQEILSKDVHLRNDVILLPGTLTYPKSKAKIPLVIFIQGSGNVDRDGNLAGTPLQIGYIKTLEESLNIHGIAFYRYDKRTATQANSDKLEDTTLSDFVVDAQIAIDYFEKDNRFNSIHLIGHSQGSLVAMLSITKTISSFISLAGAGETIDKKITSQVKAQNPELAKITQAHFEELLAKDTIAEVNLMLLSIFAPRNQKFLKNWAETDPISEIKKIAIPILILNGDSDIQVGITDAENLHKANANAHLRIIPKMNHVLKEINSPIENQQSYSQKEFPFPGVLVKEIVSFIHIYK